MKIPRIFQQLLNVAYAIFIGVLFSAPFWLVIVCEIVYGPICRM